MVAFIVAVMITCFHAHGTLQKAITGAGWVLIAILVIGVAFTSVLETEFNEPSFDGESPGASSSSIDLNSETETSTISTISRPLTESLRRTYRKVGTHSDTSFLEKGGS